MCTLTGLDLHAVALVAGTVAVLCHHSCCVYLPAVQVGQHTVVHMVSALMHVAIGALSLHYVHLASFAEVPRHVHHIAAAVQTGLQVLRNARLCGGKITTEILTVTPYLLRAIQDSEFPQSDQFNLTIPVLVFFFLNL